MTTPSRDDPRRAFRAGMVFVLVGGASTKDGFGGWEWIDAGEPFAACDTVLPA